MSKRRLPLIFSVLCLFGALMLSEAPPAAAATASRAAVARVESGLVDVNLEFSYEAAGGAGTGMLLSADGEVLTNNHVVRDATTLSVVDVANHRTYSASVLGYDVGADVAVIRLHGARRLRVVPLGNSASVRPGDAVTAVGNAGGVGGAPSTTSGSVTALHRSITAGDELGGAEQLNGLIEMNAALQPGDSGGPLVSSTGKVVAMDTAGSTGLAVASSASAGFAVPINQALRIARDIVAGHSSTAIHVGPTAFLGVNVEQREYFTGSSLASELVVTNVLPGTPAATAGIAPGDVISSFDGTALSSRTTLTDLLIAAAPGEVVPLVWEPPLGSTQDANVTLASGPAQ